MTVTSPVRPGTPQGDLEQVAVNTIRFLAADGVEQANSGHPGMPMGMADVAYVVWTKFLRYQPQDPLWPNRDRFVLSAGHGSMLLYSLLHLAGYEVSMDDLKHFRQLGSITPGHPERGLTPGVETTTGPLGQGLGNAVGMALGSRMLAARLALGGASPIDYRVFAIAGDGDMMEGVASEAASLAGHWGLGNLLVYYDDNRITIEGDTSLAFSEDVGKRFEAYGWAVEYASAYDRSGIAAATERLLADASRPGLIVTRSHIGYGAPKKQDTRSAHGEPLGADELAGAKRALGWPETPPFLVPDEVRGLFERRAEALRPDYDRWQDTLQRRRAADATFREAWDALMAAKLPDDLWARLLAVAPRKAGATRAHGNVVLQAAAAAIPSLVGGSADLEPSTKTAIAGSGSVQRAAFDGRNFHFGVREHGMVAIANGIASTGALIPYVSSFLVFTDYCRPSIRLSALMKTHVIMVFTHDSVFLGEDGPTHQPIEHLTALRAIPNLLVVRPADGVESAAAWALALERRDGPTLLALTRQNTPAIEWPADIGEATLRRGGYVVRDAAAGAITLIATGSEVGVALDAAKLLGDRDIAVRVVSMPAPQLFLAQPQAWRDAVLPPGGRRVSLEAGATDYWWRIVGEHGLPIGIDTFGESAPAADVAKHFGITPGAVAARIEEWAKG